MLLTTLFICLHTYHHFARDLDEVTPFSRILLSMLLVIVAELILPEWLLLTLMTPYFIVLMFGFSAWSVTASRSLISDRRHSNGNGLPVYDEKRTT
jgi:membrane-anchored protein YejM (alkaline phosphatase superfamily)